MLGELTRAQEEAKSILAQTRGEEDKTFLQGAIGSATYADDITADMAVIFNSLFKREEISFVDVQMAVDFQDYLDSLGYEIRRKTRRR